MSNAQLLYTQWNVDSNGNKISIPVLREIHQIVNGQLLLVQIPDEIFKVTITGMNEIKKNQSITSGSQYKVDYNTGLVYFHPSKEGGTIEITQYYGRGIILIDKSRIVTDNNGSTVVQTLQDLVIANQTAIADETVRVNNETTRKSAETARQSAEATRISNDLARGSAEGLRVTAENSRVSAETARQTAEANRVSAETVRTTNETSRQTAEATRVSNENSRIAAYNAAVTAYNAAVASQSNVEVTTARFDGNTNITYPDLQSRLNAANLAPVIRETIPSGFTKIGTLDYTYMSTNPNTIKFADEWIAFVNGFKVVIPAGTLVTLDVPPVQNSREDLVFLEVWLDQTSGVTKNRLRVVNGVDFINFKEGLENNNTNTILNPLVQAQGGNTQVLNNSSTWSVSNNWWLYSSFFKTSDRIPSYGVTGKNVLLSDSGLFVAGTGDSTSKTTLKTLDGYSYAVPIFRIPRRPSCGYMETGEYEKISPLTLGNLQQRIIAKDRIAHSGDGSVKIKIEGRTLVNLLGYAGDCEDLSKWSNSGGFSLDSTIKLFGNNSFKTSTNSNITKDVLCDQTHKYFISAYANYTTYTSGNFALVIGDYGTLSNIGSAVFDTTKVNQWQRKSLIATGKANGGIRISLTTNIAGTHAINLDGICIYDLTALGLDTITDVAVLESKLPFVSGVGSVSPVSIKNSGKNLFDFTRSINSSYSNTIRTLLSNGIEVNGGTNPNYSSVDYKLTLKPNTQYTLSLTHTRVTGTSSRVLITDNQITTILSQTLTTGSISLTFTVPNDGKIALVFYGKYNVVETGDAKFTNIQLEEGSVATTYEAYQESSIVLPQECDNLKSIGSTVKDYVDLENRKCVRNISYDWRNMTGTDSWNYVYTDIPGQKRVRTSGAVSNFAIGNNQLFIKYNNIPLKPPETIIDGVSLYSNGDMHFGLSNIDTGWSDGYTPASNEISSYFYGWKMCHSDGVSPYVPSLVPYTPATWAEWTLTSGGTMTRDSSGMLVSVGVGEWGKIYIPTSIKPSTKYGILYNLISSDIVQNLALGGDTFTYENIPKVVGNNKFVATSKASITQNNFAIQLYMASTALGSYKIKDIRVFELPTGSQIETDFNTLTADQLTAKYLFYGLNPKNWKKVTDGTGQTATLPTASYAEYTPYKMCYQLATPVETDLTDLVKGRLYASTGVNNFIVDNIMTDIKMPVDQSNLVTNGDFSNGTTGWNAGGSYGTISANNNVLTVTGNGTNLSLIADASANLTQFPSIGDKLYGRVKVTSISTGVTYLIYKLQCSGANQTFKSITAPVQNTEYIISGVVTAQPDIGIMARPRIEADYTDAASQNGKTIQIKEIYVVNLTKIFGAGNEPDQAWCDKYLEFGTNYLITGNINTTALAVQRDNKNNFYGVNKQFAVIPATKYKTGKYELLYKPADGTVLIPDTSITVGSQSLAMTTNTSVGSITLADTDVGYEKKLDGSKSRIYITADAPFTSNSVVTLNINNSIALRVGEILYIYNKNFKVTVTEIINATQIKVKTDLGSTGTFWNSYNIYKLTDRPDNLYSDIIDQNDILQLTHKVSLTGFDYRSLLNSEFDTLCRGENTQY